MVSTPAFNVSSLGAQAAGAYVVCLDMSVPPSCLADLGLSFNVPERPNGGKSECFFMRLLVFVWVIFMENMFK